MLALTKLLLLLSIVNVGLAEKAVDGPCLEYVACYNERYLDHSHMEIHHYDLSPRTASSCLSPCLKERPSTQVVIVKMVELNERLVCGCGDNEALGNSGGIVQDLLGCDRCPEGKEKCGGHVTVSIYRVEQSGECREGLQPGPPIPTTTTTTSTTTTATTTTTTVTPYHLASKKGTGTMEFLGCVKSHLVKSSAVHPHLQIRLGREADRCLATCTSTPHLEYVFLRIVGSAVYCGCGTSDAISSPVSPAGCGGGPSAHLGGDDIFAVYRAGAARHPLSSCLYLAAVAVITLVLY